MKSSDLRAAARDLRGAPRDCMVITSLPDLAALARRQGRRSLLLGRDFADQVDLRDRWSELTRRVGMAHVVGPDWLCQSVEALCQTTQINTTTGSRRSRRWTEHTLRAMPLLAEYPAGLKPDALRGMPCFIVGSGPSLDRNALLLKHAAKRGVVIRVNSASAVPGQCTLSIESNDIRHKLHCDERSVRLFGVAAPTATLDHGKGPLRPIWAGEIAWVPEALTGIPRLPTSGSASTSAVMLAHRWGCDPVVLVGQDMAMPDGRVYATVTGHGDDTIGDDGAFHWGEASKAAPRPLNPLPEAEPVHTTRAWGGTGEVLCTHTQRSIRIWMTVAADNIGKRTLNATEGGAHVPGWSDVTLASVLESLPERSDVDVGTIAHRIASPLVPLEDVHRWLLEEAPDRLAEAWAMPDAVEYLFSVRENPPHWWLPRERHTRLSMRATLLALKEGARQDVQRLCEEIVAAS